MLANTIPHFIDSIQVDSTTLCNPCEGCQVKHRDSDESAEFVPVWMANSWFVRCAEIVSRGVPGGRRSPVGQRGHTFASKILAGLVPAAHGHDEREQGAGDFWAGACRPVDVGCAQAETGNTSLGSDE